MRPNPSPVADVSDDPLMRLIDAELGLSQPPVIARLARQLAERAAGRAAAVLFYGSALRDGTLDGILDFYVLVDRVGAWPGSRLAAIANFMLPPNVGYFEDCVDGQSVRAKYAVMSLDQFRRGMSERRIDTTLWARFVQPCACVWARGADDLHAVADALRLATITAAKWAAALGPEHGEAVDYWRALFARTYDAELRVEGSARGADLVARDTVRHVRLLPAAWHAAGVPFDATADGRLHPKLTPPARAAADRRWARRRQLGRALNMLRLIKAAFTFDGAIDYVAWKVERHSGVRLEIRPWQRRHPLLAAPQLYCQLRKRGVLR
jgi:hypothetical protein